MKSYTYFLFDLDGTIIDPVEGITRSVAYALNFFDIQVDDPVSLYPFIGPPLLDSFKEFYSFSDEQAQQAVLKYRERYVQKGIYENTLYDGITELLKDLKSAGKKQMLATSKPQPFAERILSHLNLTSYFNFVGGSGLDGSRHTKADVIRFVLESNSITDLSSVVMIGDRKHDIIGAKECGIDSVGVLYGYGSREELSQAGADYITKDIEALRNLLMGNK